MWATSDRARRDRIHRKPSGTSKSSSDGSTWSLATSEHPPPFPCGRSVDAEMDGVAVGVEVNTGLVGLAVGLKASVELGVGVDVALVSDCRILNTPVVVAA